jgi:hypothetical protein
MELTNRITTFDAIAPRVFVDPKDRFSLQVPEGWSVDTSGQQGSRLILYHPLAEDGFRPNVNVVVDDLMPLTHEEYLTLCQLQLKRLSRSALLLVDEPDAHGGRVFEWAASALLPKPMQGRQLVALGHGKAFVVTAMAPRLHFESHRSEFQAVLDSLQLP